MTGPITLTESGVYLRVRVQPRATRDEVVGQHGDAIRIRVHAPPLDGAANEALLRFLAGRLRVSKSAVTLVSGIRSRWKVVGIVGLGEAEVRKRLGLDTGPIRPGR